MIALATIAPVRPDELFRQRQRIQDALAEGSVITVDNGVEVLAAVAAADAAYRAELLPYLFHHLATCQPRDVPQHSEAIVPAVDAAHADTFVVVLERRLANLSVGQTTRVQRVIAKARQAAKQMG